MWHMINGAAYPVQLFEQQGGFFQCGIEQKLNLLVFGHHFLQLFFLGQNHGLFRPQGFHAQFQEIEINFC